MTAHKHWAECWFSACQQLKGCQYPKKCGKESQPRCADCDESLLCWGDRYEACSYKPRTPPSATRRSDSGSAIAMLLKECRDFKLEHRAHTKAYTGFNRLEFLLTALKELDDAAWQSLPSQSRPSDEQFLRTNEPRECPACWGNGYTAGESETDKVPCGICAETGKVLPYGIASSTREMEPNARQRQAVSEWLSGLRNMQENGGEIDWIALAHNIAASVIFHGTPSAIGEKK